ncbi:electron transfer flavoprotein subunit beta/FixA family protein, partial [Klebsiella pneumoniae]|nr:electron transfer flavoprotein subunit beta/FixA family protein [Klebsiella pneumoniae]
DLVADISPRLKTVKFAEPEARQAGVKGASAAELVEKLKNEAKVI